MGATVSDLANAAADTYTPTGNIGGQWTPITISDQEITDRMAQSGYSGEAWVNMQTGEVIVASRGTEPTNTINIQSDLEIAVGLPNHAQDVADQFGAAAVTQAKMMLNEVGGTLTTLYSTGHSLGGSESQGIAVKLQNMFPDVQIMNVSFDAPGIGGLVVNSGTSFSSYNFSAQGDLIRLAGGAYIPGTQSILLPYGPTVVQTSGTVAVGALFGLFGQIGGFYFGGGYDAHAMSLLQSGISDSSLGSTLVLNRADAKGRWRRFSPFPGGSYLAASHGSRCGRLDRGQSPRAMRRTDQLPQRLSRPGPSGFSVGKRAQACLIEVEATAEEIGGGLEALPVAVTAGLALDGHDLETAA